MKKIAYFLTLILIIVVSSILINDKIPFLKVKEKNSSNLLADKEDVKEVNNSFGKIVNENGKQKYFNPFYGINFTVPEGWRFSEKYIENGVVKDDFIQIFNFKDSDENKSFLQNQNKIEGAFSSNSNYSTSSEDIYVDENLKLSQINVSDKKVNVAEGNYGNTNFKTYYVPTSKTDIYLGITIYGDFKNFNVLDKLVKEL